MKSFSLAIVLGTRPEIIKLAPVIRELGRHKVPFFILHTGQHYSAVMDQVFFEQLELPAARFRLDVGSGNHGEQTGAMLGRIEEVFLREKPSHVLVHGDTNSALAGALAAVKLHIPVVHVEAGLRSYFRAMAEEVNRVLIDQVSDLLLVPTKKAGHQAEREGVSKKQIVVTGNTIVDVVLQECRRAEKKSRILETFNLEKGKYLLLTAHRPENVDDQDELARIIVGIKKISVKHKLPIVWPLHPRTRKNLQSFELMSSVNEIPTLKIVEPVGFWDFLSLEMNARLIITDSGGIQEEACILKVPCVTLRENTERPETVEVRSNILVGTDPKKIAAGVERMLLSSRKWKNPFGDGKSAEKSVAALLKKYR